MPDQKFRVGDIVRLRADIQSAGYWPKNSLGGRYRILEEVNHGGFPAFRIEPLNGSPMPNLSAGHPVVQWFELDEFLTAVSRANVKKIRAR